jgi:hypothetical protein
MFNATSVSTMLVGAIMLAIRQYTDPICVLEAQLDHIIPNTTVVLMRSQCKDHQAVRFLQDTESAVNIAAWATWPAVQHTQPSQAAAAPAMQLTQLMPAGAVLAPVALLE